MLSLFLMYKSKKTITNNKAELKQFDFNWWNEQIMFYHKTCSNHVSISDERSQICTVPDTGVLRNPNYHFLTGQIEFFNQPQ